VTAVELCDGNARTGKGVTDAFGNLLVALHTGLVDGWLVTAARIQQVIAASAAVWVGAAGLGWQPRIAERITLAVMANAAAAGIPGQGSLPRAR
jgi:hypothetical protein